MSGCADDTEDDHALRDDRIDNHRAENLVVLTEVFGHLGSLSHTTFNMYRGYASLCLSDIESFFLETVLDSVGNSPALLAEFVAFR